jgi:hypothetical protein
MKPDEGGEPAGERSVRRNDRMPLPHRIAVVGRVCERTDDRAVEEGGGGEIDHDPFARCADPVPLVRRRQLRWQALPLPFGSGILTAGQLGRVLPPRVYPARV